MYKDLIANWITRKEVSAEAKLGMLDAVLDAYPLIILSNLTRNEYVLLKNENFLFHDMPECGNFDELIDIGSDNIHVNYQDAFYDCFDRQNLLKSYSCGKKEIYAELYQKRKDLSYFWISAHVIRLPNEGDDIIQICFAREIPDRDSNVRIGRK